MAVGIRVNELTLVREADGLEIDLWPLQGFTVNVDTVCDAE